MNNINYTYELKFKVRDYECDLQGIVNNSVYLNYLEHTRHEYLKEIGIDFAELSRNGIYPVVVRIEIDYKSPLKSGDEFTVKLAKETTGRFKVCFHQMIQKESDGSISVIADVYAAVIKGNRPMPVDEILRL